MRRMLDITDINSVAGKKLYLHEIKFDYNTVTENVMNARYSAKFLSSDSSIKTSVDDLETFRKNSIFLYGVKETANGLLETQYQILMIPEGNYNIAFVIIDLDKLTIHTDSNEDFTIVSDTVTEWN